MSSAEDYAKAFEDNEREAEERRSTPSALEAQDLSQDIGPDLGHEERERLEELSTCGDPVAESIADSALSQQSAYDNRPNWYS